MKVYRLPEFKDPGSLPPQRSMASVQLRGCCELIACYPKGYVQTNVAQNMGMTRQQLFEEGTEKLKVEKGDK